MSNEKPFEVAYEKTKQSIIQLASIIAQQNDIPLLILNIIMYEIGLEARNATYANVLATTDVSYPDNSSDNQSEDKNDTKEKTKTVSMKTADALEQLRKTGVNIHTTNETPVTSDSSE